METLKEFAWKVNNEGIGYAVLHYWGRDINLVIEDQDEFIEKWQQAYDLLVFLQDKIDEWDEEK